MALDNAHPRIANQQRSYLQFMNFSGAAPSSPQLIDARHCCCVIFFVTTRPDVHHTVSAMIWTRYDAAITHALAERADRRLAPE